MIVSIAEETVDKCTETSVCTPMAINTSGVPQTLTYGKVCRGFITKALEFIIEYSRPVGNVQIATLEDREVVYITLQNTKETARFFDTFKRLGINIGTLMLGFERNFKTLYVTGKLFKDLTRHKGTETLSAITMYMLTLGHFFYKLYARTEKYVVDAYARTVTLDSGFEAMFAVMNDGNFSVDVKEIATEDFNRLDWYAGAYSEYAYTLPSSCVEGKYNIVTRSDGSQLLVVEYNAGPSPYYFIIDENAYIRTNMGLSYFELSPDSLTRALSPRLMKGCVIETSQDAISETWTTVDVDEASNTVKGMLTDLMSRTTLEEGISKDKIQCALGVIVKGNTGAVDCEAVKEAYKEDGYAQQLYNQAQAYYEDYDLGSLTSLVAGFAKGDVFAMLFTGASGTGKSTSARVIPYRCGIPYLSLNFSVNIEESDLFGSMVPNCEKKEASDPEFVWEDGIITKAIRNGYCVILEEINFARPGVLGKLNSLLDENRQIDLPTGEIVKAHPNFRIIATCNIAYEGTNRLNKAFINRFEQVVVFEKLSVDKIISVIKSRTGYTKDDNIASILDVYNAIEKFSTEQNLDLVISVRQLLNVFKQGRYYKTAQEAVENIIINGAFIECPEYLDTFKKTILPAFNLKFKI